MHPSLKWEAFKNGNTKTQPDKEIRKKRKWWSGARGGRLFQPTIKQKCSFRLACLRFIEPCLAMCCTIHYKAFKSPSERERPCTVSCENTETTHNILPEHQKSSPPRLRSVSHWQHSKAVRIIHSRVLNREHKAELEFRHRIAAINNNYTHSLRFWQNV